MMDIMETPDYSVQLNIICEKISLLETKIDEMSKLIEIVFEPTSTNHKPAIIDHKYEEMKATAKEFVKQNGSFQNEIVEIEFEPYKNCFKIIGDTKAYKEIIKNNYGKWNPTFNCWIVGKTKVGNMKEVLNKIENVVII